MNNNHEQKHDALRLVALGNALIVTAALAAIFGLYVYGGRTICLLPAIMAWACCSTVEIR